MVFLHPCVQETIYNFFVKETDPVLKDNYHKSFETHRNDIIMLIRTSEKQYYAKYFEENHCNVKKTWNGIRNLIIITKKSSTKIDKLFADNKIVTARNDIVNSMNNFVCKYCPFY